MFQVVAKPPMSRDKREAQKKMTKVAAFIESKARGPKLQILQVQSVSQLNSMRKL